MKKERTEGIRIRHVLADGRELDSIEGYVVPPTGRTEAVYRLVAEFLVANSKPDACRQVVKET